MMPDSVVIFLTIISIIAGVAPLIAVFVLTRPRPDAPEDEFDQGEAGESAEEDGRAP